MRNQMQIYSFSLTHTHTHTLFGYLLLFTQIIVVALLITGCILADDDPKFIVANITDDTIFNTTIASIASTTKLPVSTSPETFPLLEDLILAEAAAAANNPNNGENFDDEKNTAKRTISSKFTGPIVVSEEVNLFTPADDFARKQRINVQIIEPESHNNGQFLKETVYQQENSTVITSKITTTSTTKRPSRRKNIVVEQKFLAPIQAGLRLSNDARQGQRPDDEDCDDQTERTNSIVTEKARVLENVDIQQNTKIQKIIYKDEPKPNFVFGARVSSTTRPPCDQSLPCSTQRPYKTSSSPRLKPINTTPLVPPRTYTTPQTVSTPRTFTAARPVTYSFTTTPRPLAPTVVTHVTPVAVPVPVQGPVKTVKTIVPVVTEKPVYIHTHSEVPVVHKQYVQLPPKIIEKPVIHKQVVQLPPQVHVVERPRIVVQKEFVQAPPQERIVPVEVEKLVVKEVPINNIIEKHIEHPPAVVEKLVPYPVASKPIEVHRIVEVPIDRVVEKTVPVS